MKKLLSFGLLLSFTATACTSTISEPQTESAETVLQEQSEREQIETKSESIDEGIYQVMYEPEDRERPAPDAKQYLFRNNEKILEVSLLEWLGGEERFPPELYYSVDIWFQRDKGDKAIVYFVTGRECGGCYSYEDNYMVIDKETNEITRKALPHKPVRSEHLFSSDKSKAAFLGVDEKDILKTDNSIYIYDFEAETVEKFMDIPSGQKVSEPGHAGFYLLEDALYWDETSGELIINPAVSDTRRT